jgi:hypothetical protein
MEPTNKPRKEKSLIEPFSFGVVAEDKAPNSPWVEIIPVEYHFMQSSKVQAKIHSRDVTHLSANAQDNLQENTSDTIRAKWMVYNSLQVTPPDVCRGDEVMIHRLGKTDIYFWEDLNSANVKRLVNVIEAYPADPANQMADDLSNAYVWQVSTRDGLVQLRTSMANGEKCQFLFQFNPKDGSHNCTDQKGNKYWINSIENDVGMENANGSKVNINKEEGFMFAKKRWQIKADHVEILDNKFTHFTKGKKTVRSGEYHHDTEKATFTGGVWMQEATINNITFTLHSHYEQGDGKPVSKPHQP